MPTRLPASLCSLVRFTSKFQRHTCQDHHQCRGHQGRQAIHLPSVITLTKLKGWDKNCSNRKSRIFSLILQFQLCKLQQRRHFSRIRHLTVNRLYHHISQTRWQKYARRNWSHPSLPAPVCLKPSVQLRNQECLEKKSRPRRKVTVKLLLRLTLKRV
jgi:hypothetical protein